MKMILRRTIDVNRSDTSLSQKEEIGTWRSDFHFRFSHSFSMILQKNTKLQKIINIITKKYRISYLKFTNSITKRKHFIPFYTSVNTSYHGNSVNFSLNHYRSTKY